MAFARGRRVSRTDSRTGRRDSSWIGGRANGRVGGGTGTRACSRVGSRTVPLSGAGWIGIFDLAKLFAAFTAAFWFQPQGCIFPLFSYALLFALFGIN